MATRSRNGTPTEGAAPRTFSIAFDGKPERALALAVYVFDRGGRIAAVAPVKDGKAQASLSDAQLRGRIFVGPAPERGKKELPTPRSLERMRALEITNRFAPGTRDFQLAPIPEIHWKWWFWCACRVQGQTVKRVNLGGGTYEDRPVPQARVHICEVDYLPLVIVKLPDPDIFRLRDDLLEALATPSIPIPPPLPDPPPFDPGFIDPLPEPLRRLAMSGLNPQPLPPREAVSMAAMRLAPGVIAGFDPQPDPPAMRAEAISGLALSARSALVSSSASVVRQALIDNVRLIHPYLCLWPWFWPWLTCQEVAVVDTDAHGRFDTTIYYPCFGDHPDLYFWVEYFIDGAWTTVYAPPMRCYTYWNYPCGSDVTIRITDPRVPTSAPDPTGLDGPQVHVIRLGGEYVSEITPAGLTPEGRPFAMSLRPYIEYNAEALAAAGITHYRWSYRRLTLADGATPVADTWHVLSRNVTHHYTEIAGDGSWHVKPFELGPDPAVAGIAFKLRPTEPPLLPGALNGWWTSLGVDSLISGYFDSQLAAIPAEETALSGGAKHAAGFFQLKLEVLRIVGGAPVVANLARDGFVIPPDPVPASGDFVPVTAPVSMVELVDPMNPATSQVSAFTMTLRVDNYPCEALIHNVTVGAEVSGPCGMIGYTGNPSAVLSFKARHPQNFATFSFNVVKGSSGSVEYANGSVGDPSPDGYTRSSASVFTKSIPVATLLNGAGTSCTSAAFAEGLYVNALATDGYGEINAFDRSDMKAFGLTPSS